MQLKLDKLSKATVTPLASIFGSGFLVIVSVLASITGKFSVFAMILICLGAYTVGDVMRFNIGVTERHLDAGTASRRARSIDRFSDLALVPAYVISVSLYLRIMAGYALGAFDADTPTNERLVATGALLIILAIALTRGLGVLTKMETSALLVTLLLIALMLVTFVVVDVGAFLGSGLEMPTVENPDLWNTITILAGALIVVQGFETTRYLAKDYDTETRITACRNSQLISTVVYVVFIAVSTPLMHYIAGDTSQNALMKMAGDAAPFLVVPLVFAAILSQFSAAAADSIGASGNILEYTSNKITAKPSYVIICTGAIILTWLGSSAQILALASRAFAFYYLLQAWLAITVNDKNTQRAYYSGVAALMLFITIFAQPVG